MAPGSLNVNSTLGAIFIGFALACVVYGILITQVFTYFRRYTQDHGYLKFLVIAILLLETADQAFIGHLSYYYTVLNYNKPETLLRANVTWSLILQLTAGAIVGAIVKLSFGMRVWRFSRRNYYITGLIILLSLGQLGLALVFTVKSFQLPSIFAVHDLKLLGTVSLATGVATDIVTAFSLCYFLNNLRTGYKTSDSLVNSLVRYAINTGALTSAVSLTTLILFNVMTNDLYFVGTYFILSKLYAISFLATLTTRRAVRGRGTDRQEPTASTTNMFPLGTRLPEGGLDYERGWDTGKAEVDMQEFPYNTFASPQAVKPRPLV